MAQTMITSDTRQKHPASAHLVVRIGVTGHRSEGLARAGFKEPALRSTIRDVLTSIQDIAERVLEDSIPNYRGRKPILRLISPLAEGADRVVAEEARSGDLKFEIQSPLPFTAEEYENDFS